VTHPNVERLRTLYDNFGKGDLEAVLSACAEEIVFHVPGHSPLRGSYTKAQFAPGLITKVMQLSAGTFQESVDEVLAGDTQGVVLATHRLQRNGTAHEYQTAHVWQIRDGLFTGWREYPRDLYQFDAIWS
jgi:ketosteroid isomerase-like protein